MKYTLTPMIISGGQTVRYDITLSCDRSKNEEFCTRSAQLPKRIAGAIPPDGQLTQNIDIVDDQAAFWYNKATLNTQYLIGNRWENTTASFPIIRKGGMIQECHAAAGAFNRDIDCSSYSLGDFGSVELEQATFAPFRGRGITQEVPATFFPGNNIGVKLQLRPFGIYNSPTLLKYNILGRDRSESGSRVISQEDIQSGQTVVNLLDITTTASTAQCSTLGQDLSTPLTTALIAGLKIPSTLTPLNKFKIKASSNINALFVVANDQIQRCDVTNDIAICTKPPGNIVQSITIQLINHETPTIAVEAEGIASFKPNANFQAANQQNVLGATCKKFRLTSTNPILDIRYTYAIESNEAPITETCNAGGQTQAECIKLDKPIQNLRVDVESPIHQEVIVQCVDETGPLGSAVKLYTEVACQSQRGFPVGTYDLELGLFQDVDGNRQFSEGDVPLLFGGREQQARLRFDIQSNTDGHVAPIVEIVEPKENSLECEYTSNDIKVAVWDDTNKQTFLVNNNQLTDPTVDPATGTYTLRNVIGTNRLEPIIIAVKDDLGNEGRDSVTLEQC